MNNTNLPNLKEDLIDCDVDDLHRSSECQLCRTPFTLDDHTTKNWYVAVNHSWEPGDQYMHVFHRVCPQDDCNEPTR